jgi:TonB family protein
MACSNASKGAPILLNNFRPWTLLLCLSIAPANLRGQTQPANVPASPAARAVAAPNPKTPEEFFARACQLSDLEASGIPFHLKAAYVATGDAKLTGHGTYEEWWRSEDVWRKEATLGDYKYVAINNGDTLTTYAAASYMPLRVRQVLNSVLVHIGACVGNSQEPLRVRKVRNLELVDFGPGVGNSKDWKLERKKLKGVDFAILTSENDCGMKREDLKCYAEDYFTDEGVLRIRVNEVTEELYNDIQAFKTLLIPHSVTLSSDGDKILDISLTTLEPLSPNETMLSKDAPVPAIPRISPVKKIRVESRVASARVIHQVTPVYPAVAKQRGMAGTVVLAAHIGTDGKISDLNVVHSIGPMLDKAALEAVRRWRYRPTTIDGTPVIVDTTIRVIFSLSR